MTENNTHVSLPEPVEARQVTLENIEEISRWCNGKVSTEPDFPQGQLRVEVEQTNYVGEVSSVFAYPGDWVVLHEGSRFMVYMDRYFSQKFTREKSMDHAIKEFIVGAMNEVSERGWTSEQTDSYATETSQAISAFVEYYQAQARLKQPLKILPHVKTAMVGAIDVMSRENLTEAEQMAQMNAVASDATRKIASTT